MAMDIKQVGPTFAGEVTGIDLRLPLDAKQVAFVEAGMDEFAVLVFRNQLITDTQQLEFSNNFGRIESSEGGNPTSKPHNRRLRVDMADVSNLNEKQDVFDRFDRRRLFNLGNRLWHSDSAFRATPAKYSLLSARHVPKNGPNTEYADMRAAYDALPDDKTAEIEGLMTEHSAFHSRMQLGDQQYTPEDLAKYPTVEWPIVRTHPGSQRKTLFIGAHVTRVLDWPVPEGRLLLADLLEHATQRQFVYRHNWCAGDLVIWDNRAVLHRGRRYDLTQRRELRRSTVEDVAA
mgnify:CR=1 FL=1